MRSRNLGFATLLELLLELRRFLYESSTLLKWSFICFCGDTLESCCYHLWAVWLLIDGYLRDSLVRSRVQYRWYVQWCRGNQIRLLNNLCGWYHLWNLSCRRKLRELLRLKALKLLSRWLLKQLHEELVLSVRVSTYRQSNDLLRDLVDLCYLSGNLWISWCYKILFYRTFALIIDQITVDLRIIIHKSGLSLFLLLDHRLQGWYILVGLFLLQLLWYGTLWWLLWDRLRLANLIAGQLKQFIVLLELQCARSDKLRLL